MEIPTDKLLALLRQQGNHDQADQANRELPDKVTPERDSGRLDRFGLKPLDVASKLGGIRACRTKRVGGAARWDR
jgi:hypothetical protein